MRRIMVVGWNTFREIVRQRVFILIVLGFCLLIASSFYLIDFHLSDDLTGEVIQMGGVSMNICALLVVMISSSRTIHDEIEKKTVLSVLSMPINRDQFLLGKYVGILGAAILGIVLLGVALFLTILIQEKMGKHPSGNEALQLWLDVGMRGALVSILLALVMAAFAVLFSSWFPQEMTAASLLGFYFLGHMSSRMRCYFEDQGWTWLARGIYYLIPNLEVFTIDRAVSTQTPVTDAYLSWVLIYSVTVAAGIMILTLALFRRRELG